MSYCTVRGAVLELRTAEPASVSNVAPSGRRIAPVIASAVSNEAHPNLALSFQRLLSKTTALTVSVPRTWKV